MLDRTHSVFCTKHIRPHIEYRRGIQGWNPYYTKHIDMLEKIQHCMGNEVIISHLSNLPYKEPVQILNQFDSIKFFYRINNPHLMYSKLRGHD